MPGPGGVEDRVAPVCMSSASVRTVSDEVLPCFEGKRVRIFVHDDDAGYKAANRWTQRLRGVSSQVDGYRFDGLIQADGTPVRDLNDLLRVDYDCWEQYRETINATMSFAMEGR